MIRGLRITSPSTKPIIVARIHFRSSLYSFLIVINGFVSSASIGSCSKRSSKFFLQFRQKTSVARQAVPQLGQMSSFFGVNNFFFIKSRLLIDFKEVDGF